jgi:hypothetical protein
MGQSDVFGGHSAGLEKAGKDITTAAQNFEGEYLKIYSVIDALIGSEWSSPAAETIAKQIEGQRPNLEAMRDAIKGYADYCFRTSNRVIENEENIISGVSGSNE